MVRDAAQHLYTAQVFEREDGNEPISPLNERRVGIVLDATERLIALEGTLNPAPAPSEEAVAEAVLEDERYIKAGISAAEEYANNMTDHARQLVSDAYGA